MKKLTTIPVFKNEAEERVFWAKHNSTAYIDWSTAKKVVFPNLKPTTEKISLRLPKTLLMRIKSLAAAQDVPYQSLMKILLSQKVDEMRVVKGLL